MVKVLLNGTEVDLVRPGSSRISRYEINQMNLANILKPPLEKTETPKNNTSISDETANRTQPVIVPPKEESTN